MTGADAREPFEFSRAYIISRFKEHWGLAEEFCEAFLSAFGLRSDIAIVDTRKLKFAIDSAYQDIARYKDYHQKNPEEDLLDCTKRCAFLVKWILKFKPIVLIDANITDDDVDYIELVNEAFCLYLFEIHLSSEISFDIMISEDKVRHLAYDMMYRNITVDGWISIFTLFKECVYPVNLAGQVPFISPLPAA